MSVTDEAKSLVATLDDEIVHLCAVFSTYKHLYQNEQKMHKLLSDTDCAFFSDLYIVYLSYISVAVSRLLDPEKTGNKFNLTLFTLISVLKTGKYSQANIFEQRLRDIKSRAYNFTEPRNQLVSHLDYKANKRDDNKKAIPSFITSEFEEFYADVGILMNDIRSVLGLPPNIYTCGILEHGYGRKLVARLQASDNYIQTNPRTA